MIASPEPRVLSLEEALATRKRSAERGARVVLTNGCFDILHRGHLDYLAASAALGDVLIVAVNSDASVRWLKGADRPVHGESDRAHALACLRFVDAAFVFPGPRLVDEILLLKPDIYTKAGDYDLDSLDPGERAALQQVGADIRILPFLPGHSTTSVIERMRGAD